MNKLKLTPWFPPHIKPVHVGVYKVKTDVWGEVLFAFWTGRYWLGFCCTVKKACLAARADHGAPSITVNQNKEWRGLAVKPTEIFSTPESLFFDIGI